MPAIVGTPNRRPCELHDYPVAPFVAGQCRPCWLFVNDMRYRMLWGGNVRKVIKNRPAVANITKPIALPCIYEGAIIESCKSCGNREGRHVRQCFHPDGERDRCTRDYVSAKVQACNRCAGYDDGTLTRKALL